jgi:hypothetical protein
MFISDSGCGVVRKVDGPTQIISTIAGTAFSWGPAVSSVSFSSVKFKPDIRTVAVDSLSNLYVADSNNYVIRGLDFSQEVVYVVAGTPSVSGYSGDGVMATNAYLNIPWSVFIDSLGYAYIADTYNNRIRKVVPIAPTYATNNNQRTRTGAFLQTCCYRMNCRYQAQAGNPTTALIITITYFIITHFHLHLANLCGRHHLATVDFTNPRVNYNYVNS